MTRRALADTSLFIARESGRPLAQIELPDELAISVITLGELRAGVLTAADVATRAVRLATLTEALTVDVVEIDQAVA
ncbi:MAG: type II toxin-antitoxin system VapC family toxin, partial [Chloroflexi bacterium]